MTEPRMIGDIVSNPMGYGGWAVGGRACFGSVQPRLGEIASGGAVGDALGRRETAGQVGRSRTEFTQSISELSSKTEAVGASMSEQAEANTTRIAATIEAHATDSAENLASLRTLVLVTLVISFLALGVAIWGAVGA